MGKAENIENLLGYDGEDDPIDGQYDDISEIQSDIDGELAQMLADFDHGDLDQLEVRVYRPREGKGKLAYVFSCLPTELPILDKLRDEYGGGDFEVRLIMNKRIKRRFQVCVEPPPKPNQNNQVSEQASIARAMTDGFTRLGELIMSSQKQPETNHPNMMEMQASLLQNMVAMKEIMGSEKKQQSPISQLKELIELKKMVEDDDKEDKEANTNDVLVALINNVMPALGALSESETAALPTKNPVKSRRPQKPAPENHPKKDNTMKLQLMYLCKMAKRDVDPGPYAQMTIDNTPDERFMELYEFVSDKNKAFDSMVKIHGPVSEYKEWFSELAENIKDILTDDENGTIIESEPTGENVVSPRGGDPEEIHDQINGYSEREGRDVIDPENDAGLD